jgi:hypothetical protein
MTVQNRAEGWLNPAFKLRWDLLLLHTCARYEIACPLYVLMPDHCHLVWLGVNAKSSDQRIALEFLRKNLRPSLFPHEWQRQAFDHVLAKTERQHAVFQTVAHYILDNPVRARLVARAENWSFTGCCAPGYPNLNVHDPEYWDLFWRIYIRMVERIAESARSRSPLQNHA